MEVDPHFEARPIVDENGILHLHGVKFINPDEFRYNLNLKLLIIPTSITVIPFMAFFGCRNLQEVIFEEPCQIIELKRDYFYECIRLTKIDIPASIETISHSSFGNYYLESVILRGPCYLKDFCFQTNELTYLHIADSIQEIDDNAFYQNCWDPLLRSPCKIYIRPEFHEQIKCIFEGRPIEFIGNELDDGPILK